MRCVIFQFLYVAVLFIAIEYAFAYKQDGKCYKSLNLAVLLDASGSIEPKTWNEEIQLAKQIIQANTITASGNKFAVLDFSTTASIASNLDQDAAKANTALDTLKGNFKDGHSFIDAGLSKVAEVFAADVSAAEKTLNLLVIITDGYMTFRDGKENEEFLKAPKDKLIAAKAVTFALGVGEYIKDKTLHYIATGPPATHVFKIGGASVLLAEIKKAAEINCTETKQAAESFNCNKIVVRRMGSGCYKDNHGTSQPLPYLILTDRDSSHGNYSQQNINWEKFATYLPDFVCRCAEKTVASKYGIFGVQNYGECWSSSRMDTYDSHGAATDATQCTNTTFKQCTAADLYCIGKEQHNFVYKIEEAPGA